MAEESASEGDFEVLIAKDPIATASEVLTEALTRQLLDCDSVRLAISGGSALGVVPQSRSELGEVWSRVALTWVDERCVPISDLESNCGSAARLGLFSSVLGPATGCEPKVWLPLFEEGETPIEAVDRASSELRESFSEAIDIALLGMGGDGHIASLFPSLDQPTTGLVATVDQSPKPPSRRITMTRSMLETASVVILVASGEQKRGVIESLIAGDSGLPAEGLPGLILVTDLDLTARS